VPVLELVDRLGLAVSSVDRYLALAPITWEGLREASERTDVEFMRVARSADVGRGQRRRETELRRLMPPRASAHDACGASLAPQAIVVAQLVGGSYSDPTVTSPSAPWKVIEAKMPGSVAM
jgi:hypothetical protein